ncbi:MAG: threo-3-hydroxy-L-aspartate ammonia-lyase [Sphingomonadales bacterium]|nr:MAG: threo-3-hydroxy-L-aspartate ammonia-lyase [Sphingomonadales bacterium]
MTTDTLPLLPNFADLEAAVARIRGAAHRTPVFTSRRTDSEVGASLFYKMENFQRAGAFKFRGAYNALSRLGAAGRAAGVVAYSSGNHAQAVALAASLLACRATIVMPADAPASKRAATAGYGAEIVLFDRRTEDREAIARAIAEREGAVLLPPFNHIDIIAGQGTATIELIEEVGPLDYLFVPVGGGGLLAGSALAAAALSPGCKVIGVEPEAGDDVRQSFERGEIVSIDTPDTIADGAQTKRMGELPFAIMQSHVHSIMTVSDDALRAQMLVSLERLKVVVEPTACLGMAAALIASPPGARVGILVSGGNVDISNLCALSSQALGRTDG